MNPLYNQNSNQSVGGIGEMLNAFNQFKQTFSGDPQQQVQQLLNSGRMTQDQYNQLAQMANGLMNILK